jgi:D-inositol-3-phosphate glycosyltransferase
MKIAMVSEHASPLAAIGGVDAGGQNVHVAELATALGARGHQVVVYTRRDCPDLPVRVTFAPGADVEHLDAGPPVQIPKDQLLPHIPELTSALAARLDDDPADVLHAHFWMSGLAALGAAASAQLPVVHTFHALGSVKRRHQGAADTSPVNRLRCERRIATQATRVLASCRDERSEVLRLGAKPDRIDVVPSGVGLSVFGTGGERAERGAKHRLLVISRLVPRKGVDDAVRATALLPDTELVVAGGPAHRALDADPEVRRLRALAEGLGIADRVHLLGSVEHTALAPLIRSADAVLCLPWYEPFGIVPLEAMACGVPVIASAVGGLLDTVVDGVTGLHVSPRDPARAAEAVRRLLVDPACAAQLGRAGSEQARRYDWSVIAASVESSYRLAVQAVDRQHAEVAG